MRKPNAIDFWRGMALITIFVNHVPGNAFESWTYSHYTISDAAELFVFLAGWSIALATEGRTAQEPALRVLLRLASRAVEVYRAQMVIVLIALSMIAGTALYLDNPLILDWHHAGPFFRDPVQTTVGLVLLTHQLGFFNILPLYVGLLTLAPIFVLTARRNREGEPQRCPARYTARRLRLKLIFRAGQCRAIGSSIHSHGNFSWCSDS